MNILKKKWNDYCSDTLYLISNDYNRFVVIKEGDGSNLLPEDEDEGYKDYWITEEYDLETMSNIDGMQWMEEQLISDLNYTIEGVIERNEYDIDDYYILDNNLGEKLQSTLEDIDIHKLSVTEILLSIKGGMQK